MILFKKLLSSILLLLIGAFIVKSRILIGDGCIGMPEGIWFILLSIVYLLALTIVLTTSLIRYYKRKGKFNFYPLLATCIVVFSVILSSKSEIFESPTSLYAATMDGHSLTLRDNNTFEIQIREIEWSCFYKGTYNIENDIITLSKSNIEELTNGVFINIYKIRDIHLQPLSMELVEINDKRKLTILNN